jgi:hypothetical protein
MRTATRAWIGTVLLAALGCGGHGFRGVPVSDEGISAQEYLERGTSAHAPTSAPTSVATTQPTAPTTQPTAPSPQAP